MLQIDEFPNPEQENIATDSLNKAAEQFSAKFKVKWQFRQLRGRTTNVEALEEREIRKKLKPAIKLGYQNITHRWDRDNAFRIHQQEMGRTRENMLDYDRFASEPTVDQPMPYHLRAQKAGSAHLVLAQPGGSGTHPRWEARNYIEERRRGPPPPPDPPRVIGKDSVKGQGKGKNQQGRAGSHPQQWRRRGSWWENYEG